MTSTEPRIEGIEHLDHEPECASVHHVGDAKAAFWVRGHGGCFDALTCAPCVARNRRRIAMDLDYPGYFRCAKCGTRMTSFDEWVEVIPL